MTFIDQYHKYHNLLSEWFARPWVRFVALTIYYLGILVSLFALYCNGNFATPPFIYQHF